MDELICRLRILVENSSRDGITAAAEILVAYLVEQMQSPSSSILKHGHRPVIFAFAKTRGVKFPLHHTGGVQFRCCFTTVLSQYSATTHLENTTAHA